MFEAEKFPFKFKGKSLKKYISFASSAPLFSLFRGLISREFGAFPALLFLLRLKNARSVENQTRIPHHSKQSKSIQNQLCVRVDIHTFLQIVL